MKEDWLVEAFIIYSYQSGIVFLICAEYPKGKMIVHFPRNGMGLVLH